ncbi:MAG: hypothetical protein ACI9HK_004583 [Pirellulaceae bacterium]|jgi:hypothetical protein
MREVACIRYPTRQGGIQLGASLTHPVTLTACSWDHQSSGERIYFAAL